MKRKEITETFMMISNGKKLWSAWFIQQHVSGWMVNYYGLQGSIYSVSQKATQFCSLANQTCNWLAKCVIFYSDRIKRRDCGAWLQIATEYFQNKRNRSSVLFLPVQWTPLSWSHLKYCQLGGHNHQRSQQHSQQHSHPPHNTRLLHWTKQSVDTKVDLMLGQRRRRWPNIKIALLRRPVLAEIRCVVLNPRVCKMQHLASTQVWMSYIELFF